MIQLRVLANGLTVLHERRKTDSVAIEVLVRVGSDYENATNRGITHFIEHMVFEGTKRNDARELANAVERIGGEINAVTSQEKTFFYAIVPRQHFRRALEVLADILIHPVFDELAIAKEKRVVLDEIALLHDDPMHFTLIQLMAMLFERLPARYPTYGSAALIRRFTRKQLLAFFKWHYVARNTIVSIVGDVRDPFGAVAELFHEMPPGRHHRLRLPVERGLRWITKKTFHKKLQRAYVAVGFQAARISGKDFYALEVVRAILAKGQSSRLFHEVRTKRGLAYAVGAVYEATIHFGFFALYFSADCGNVKSILHIIFEQLALRDLREEEVDDAREFLVGSFLLANEYTRERADANASWLLFGGEPADYVRGIRSVSVNDVKRVAREYFKKNHALVITL